MAKVFRLAVWFVFSGVLGCTAQHRETQLLMTPYGAFDPLRESLPDLAHDARVATGAQTYIVQFQEPITAASRGKVAQRVRAVRGFYPTQSLVVEASAEQARVVAQLPAIRTVVAQPRLFKVDPRLLRSGPAGLVADAAQHDVLIELADGNDLAAMQQQVLLAGGTIVSRRPSGKIVHARVPGTALAPLAGLAPVRAITRYFAPKLLNDRSYGLVQAGERHASPLWQHGLLGLGQLVAVSDSGVDTQSCFFAGHKVAHYEDLTDAKDGDGDGHGTHVAGTIAGDNYANGTYDSNDGMAPAARLYVQDVADGSDLVGLPDDLAPLFASAYDYGARIHSNSWGDDDTTYSAIARSVDDFVAQHHDFLVLFAAGNSGSYASTVGSPATAKNVISVGAVYGTTPEDMAYFSSHGPTSDGRLKPTLSAPGVGVVSARRKTACGTTVKSGTSMATPTLAGAAALVRQYFTDGFYPQGTARPADAMQPSAALLKATLMAGADDMSGSDTDGHIPANGQGFGRVHLANALLFEDSQLHLWVQDEATGLDTAEEQRFTVHLAEDGPLKVALTWIDPPAEAGTASALVNDLDLTVRGPNGTYRGNILKQGVSTAHKDSLADSQAKDAVNVEELVYVPDASAGDYVIAVRGAHVPLGPQTFAVAAVGPLTGKR